MVCQGPVVCVYTNGNNDHTIGCYHCLYCKIPSNQMATPVSIQGHATERSLENMCADHQNTTSYQAVIEDMHRSFITASLGSHF